MASLAAPRKTSKSRPFTCSIVSLTIEISDTRYAVDSIPAGEFGTKAFRLCKKSGDHEVYDLIRTHHGIVECSCPDYLARHQGNGYGTCKHGRALVELGLMPAPIAPAFAPPAHVRDEFDELTPAPVVEVPAPCCSPSEPVPCVACVEPPVVTPPAPIPPDVKAAMNAMLDHRAKLAEAEARAEMEPSADFSVEPPTARCVCDSCVCGDGECEEGDAGPVWTWGAETDADTWELGPDAEAPALLTLDQLIDAEAARMTRMETHAGDLMARTLRELANTVRFVQARTPAEYEARREVLDAGLVSA